MNKIVLYIEDNADNMLLVKRVLGARGYTVLEAKNGVLGLAVAEQNDVDLILLDINLPDIDGYEVARRLRSSTKHKLAYVPIIAITAPAMTNNRQAMLAEGFDGYQTKPITLKDFLAEIDRVLQSRSK